MNGDDFTNVFTACENLSFDIFYRLDRYLFKENHLCVLLSSMRELLVCKTHVSGLMG